MRNDKKCLNLKKHQYTFISDILMLPPYYLGTKEVFFRAADADLYYIKYINYSPIKTILNESILDKKSEFYQLISNNLPKTDNYDLQNIYLSEEEMQTLIPGYRAEYYTYTELDQHRENLFSRNIPMFVSNFTNKLILELVELDPSLISKFIIDPQIDRNFSIPLATYLLHSNIVKNIESLFTSLSKINGFSPNIEDFIGDNIFHYAAFKNPKTLSILLQIFPDFDINKVNCYGHNVLMNYLFSGLDKGNTILLNDLISRGSKLYFDDPKISPLRYLMFSDDEKKASILIDVMQNQAFEQKFDGDYLLHYASAIGARKIFRMLIEKGKFSGFEIDDFGNTALFLSLINNKMRLENFQNIMETVPGIENIAHKKGFSIWHAVSAFGYLDILQYYVTNNLSNIFLKDIHDMSLMNYAAAYNQSIILDYIVKHKYANIDQKNINGWTSLFISVIFNQSNMVNHILSNYKKEVTTIFYEKDLYTISLLVQNIEINRILFKHDVSISDVVIWDEASITKIKATAKYYYCILDFSDPARNIVLLFTRDPVLNNVDFKKSQNKLKKLSCSEDPLNDYYTSINNSIMHSETYYLTYNKTACVGAFPMLDLSLGHREVYYCKIDLSFVDRAHLMVSYVNEVSYSICNEYPNICDFVKEARHMLVQNTTESAVDYINNHTSDYVGEVLYNATYSIMALGGGGLYMMRNYFSSGVYNVAYGIFLTTKFVLKNGILVTAPTYMLLTNKYVKSPLKSMTGQSEIEEGESLLNNIQKEANARIIPMMKAHPSEWIYMVEHPARCLDHALNGNNPIGRKEEVLVFTNESISHSVYVCYRSEVKPEIYSKQTTYYIPNFISAFIPAFLPSYYLYYNDYIDSGISIGLFIGLYSGLNNLFESIMPHHNVIDLAQLQAVEFIASNKEDLYLVQTPGECAADDIIVKSFGYDDINMWLVCGENTEVIDDIYLN